MPTHNYERVPVVEDELPLYPINQSYFSGIPTSAPSSFHSITNLTLPHKNDETAATVMPVSERPEVREETIQASDDPMVSVWAPSEMDFNAARDDTIVRLMDRVEALESRLEAQIPNKEQAEIDSAAKGKWHHIGTTIAVVAFMIWFMGIILLSAMTAYKRVGVKKD